MFTSEKKPHVLSERTVYLTLIAEEIRSYGAGYNLSDINLPSELAIDYLRFNNSYRDTLETCLRNFDRMKLSEFSKEYKQELKNSYSVKIREAIDKSVDYIRMKVSSKEKELPLKSAEKDNVNDKIIALLEKRAIYKMRDNEDLTEVEEVKVEIRDLPKTTVNKLEVRVNEIAENSLMIEALNHAIKRAKLDRPSAEKEKTYHFKKIRDNIKEVFRDLLINSSNEKFIKSKIEMNDADIISEAAENYEVEGNLIYLHNQRKFKKALGEYIRPILKKVRERFGKS